MSELRVTNIVGEDGLRSPTFTRGINVTGVVTATTLNQVVSGIVTATTFSGTLQGNVQGNVTGNATSADVATGLSADASVNTTGIITASSISSPTVQVGSATTVHTTGIDLGTGNITGHNITSTGTLNIPNSVTGVTTATTLTTTVYKTPAVAVGALDIDCSTGNYFTKTINGNSTFTFSGVPAAGTVCSFTLELTHTSGTVTWPTSVKWPADTAPTLTNGKTSLFMFVTDDGGTRWRGNAIVDFTN